MEELKFKFAEGLHRVKVETLVAMSEWQTLRRGGAKKGQRER